MTGHKIWAFTLYYIKELLLYKIKGDYCEIKFSREDLS